MLTVVLVVGTVFCAIEAILANRLLIAALWLAGVSALVAVTLYVLGAPQVAVVELSVGAGLVTVLFVFAISIAGDESMQASGLIPGTLAWSLILLVVVLLGWTFLTANGSAPSAANATEPSFATIFWQQRQLDTLVQIALIFTGVLSVLGLLASAIVPATRAKAEAAKPEIARPKVSPQIPETSPEPVEQAQPAVPALEKEHA